MINIFFNKNKIKSFIMLFLPFMFMSLFLNKNLVFSSGKRIDEKLKTQLILRKGVNVPICNDEEISKFEEKWNIKLPTLLKQLYKAEVDIKNLIFKSDDKKVKKVYIDSIYPLFDHEKGEFDLNELKEIKKIKKTRTYDDFVNYYSGYVTKKRIKSIESLILQKSLKRISYQYISPPSTTSIIVGYTRDGEGLIYFDNDCVWFYEFRNKCFTKFNLIN